MQKDVRWPLRARATLEVVGDSWRLSAYEPGPDLRYRGTYANWNPAELLRIREALPGAAEKYLQLKASLPDDVIEARATHDGIHVMVGGPYPGLGIHRDHYESGFRVPVERAADLVLALQEIESMGERLVRLNRELENTTD